MLKKINSSYFYYSVLLTFFLFIPFFLSKNISSDWDSYAIIGTYLNFIESGNYIPSRPPGFPLYELLVSILSYFGNKSSIGFEYFLLLFQFLTLIGLNFVIFKFINQDGELKKLNYLLIVFSPIYLISGFTVIDYSLGALLGFSGIYLYFYSTKYKNTILIPSLLIALSSAVRLSNLIYIFGLIIFLLIKKEYSQTIKFFVTTLVLTFFLYLPFYLNLYILLEQAGSISSLDEFFCVFNLTNTDLSLYDRLGRFVLKQVNLIGTIGLFVFILNFKNYEISKLDEKLYLLIIFLLFQFSFLRLPTEEGHLLPALICLFLILKFNTNKRLLAIFPLVFLSNFIDIKFYDVDVPNHAANAYLSFDLKEGFLIEDYIQRADKGANKNFNYQNAKDSIFTAWSDGCPND